MGDCHIYTNHIDPLKEQIQRVPRPFPKLIITDGMMEIDNFLPHHFELVGYKPYPKISMPMAV